jgi:hypothetical protein
MMKALDGKKEQVVAVSITEWMNAMGVMARRSR